jgi:hypothetical protein
LLHSKIFSGKVRPDLAKSGQNFNLREKLRSPTGLNTDTVKMKLWGSGGVGSSLRQESCLISRILEVLR